MVQPGPYLKGQVYGSTNGFAWRWTCIDNSPTWVNLGSGE